MVLLIWALYHMLGMRTSQVFKLSGNLLRTKYHKHNDVKKYKCSILQYCRLEEWQRSYLAKVKVPWELCYLSKNSRGINLFPQLFQLLKATTLSDGCLPSFSKPENGGWVLLTYDSDFAFVVTFPSLLLQLFCLPCWPLGTFVITLGFPG